MYQCFFLPLPSHVEIYFVLNLSLLVIRRAGGRLVFFFDHFLQTFIYYHTTPDFQIISLPLLWYIYIIFLREGGKEATKSSVGDQKLIHWFSYNWATKIPDGALKKKESRRWEVRLACGWFEWNWRLFFTCLWYGLTSFIFHGVDIFTPSA